MRPIDEDLDSLAFSLVRYAGATPALAFPVATPELADAWRAEASARLRELIGRFPTRRVDPETRIGEPVRRPGHTRRTITFATRPKLRAFGYLLTPDDAAPRSPAVLCLPGHGRGAAEIVGIDDEGRDRDHHDGYQHDFAVQCVERGYVTLALEMLGFGHRRDPASRARGAGASSCQPAAGAALMLGETMVGWRTWDAMRALDVLGGLDAVDPDRLAVMGISGGGTVGLYTAALDERVKVAVLSGSFCTFRDSIFSRSHCIDNYVPGILNWFEMADLAGLIAPRRLFCESGADDEIFPRAGVREAADAARRIYRASGAEGGFDAVIFEGGHRFDGREAFRRLAEWL